MKTCNNCGKQNNDEDLFCQQCGASLSINADGQQQSSYYQEGNPGYAGQQGYPNGNPGYAPQQYAQQAPTPYPMLQTLKARGGSALFLVAIICMTAQIFVSLYSALAGSSKLINTIESFAASLGISSSELPNMSGITQTSVAGTMIGLIPTILIVIGLWMIYINCKKTDNTPLSTTGFSLVRGTLIFQFVLYILEIVIVAVFCGIFFGAIASYSSYYSSAGSFANVTYVASDSSGSYFGVIAICVVVFAILALVLGIVYFVKAIGSVKRGKQIIQTGTAPKNISAFVGVLNIIAGLGIITGLMGMDFPTILSSLTSLLFGILIMGVRKEFARGMAQQSQQYTGMQ